MGYHDEVGFSLSWKTTNGLRAEEWYDLTSILNWHFGCYVQRKLQKNNKKQENKLRGLAINQERRLGVLDKDSSNRC